MLQGHVQVSMCFRMCVGEANKISYPQERNPLIEDIKRPGEAGELIKDGCSKYGNKFTQSFRRTDTEDI